ncbi:MAG: hypothetical protein V4596_08700 [Bdellovibrionota bacterium]
MKYILILSLFLNAQNLFAKEEMKFEFYQTPNTDSELSPDPAEPSKVKKDFLKTTGIKLGKYVQIENSDPSCLQGELAVIDLTDRVTLMLGSKPIAQSLGKKKYEEKERDCTMTFDTTYTETEINETREKICKKEKMVLKTNVKFSGDKLSYSTIIKKNGKITNEFECDLRLDVPAEQQNF